MQYEIKGSVMPILEITMDKDEVLWTEQGGMSWMNDGIKMDTGGRGGIGGFLGRMVTGEGAWITYYIAERDNAKIVFTPELPGHVVPIELAEGQAIIAQQDAFMVATEHVRRSVHIQRRLGAGFIGGEGFILQKISGPGIAFLEIGGEVAEYTLAPNETMRVNPGYVAMYEPSVDYDIQRVRGIKNMLFGGEDLYLANLKGPGKIWLQSMPFSQFMQQVIARLPQEEVKQVVVQQPADEKKDE
jgi:uncharacterized protein (TIGR00266 family)